MDASIRCRDRFGDRGEAREQQVVQSPLVGSR